jgi:hypothetical protein
MGFVCQNTHCGKNLPIIYGIFGRFYGTSAAKVWIFYGFRNLLCILTCFLRIFWALPSPPGGGCGSGYTRLTYLRPLPRAWYGLLPQAAAPIPSARASPAANTALVYRLLAKMKATKKTSQKASQRH